MNNSPGVFDEGEGQVQLGVNPVTKQPIIMYSPQLVAAKFEQRARDARQGKTAMQSAANLEVMTGQIQALTEKTALLEEQLAKSAERAQYGKK